MNLAEAVGRRLVECGVDHAFGVVGSGNFHVTNAMIAAGARFFAAAHEGGAASMADAYARVSGKSAALSVHQGPGVTNALTGITEAAKSRTPLIVLAPEATHAGSNFYIDLASASGAVDATYRRVVPEQASESVAWACRTAFGEPGRTVILGLPLDVQQQPSGPLAGVTLPPVDPPSPSGVEALASALASASRPCFIAGRGAARSRGAREALLELAQQCGALLAVSAAAKGLFESDPWDLDIAGGFATPLASELTREADLIVAWGCTLNMWTTKHGRSIAPGTIVARVDVEPSAFGRGRAADITVTGDVTGVARACQRWIATSAVGSKWRTPELRARIAGEGRWSRVQFTDESTAAEIDPRRLTIELDRLLPRARTVVVDSGNFMGYPSMFLSVPDAAGFCFMQAFQSIGLGLAGALGAAIARPDRLTVAAIGDGGFLMSLAELSTAVRLHLAPLIVVYNDAAYGAEVHHFRPQGHSLTTVAFPDTDLASIACGFGCDAITVRTQEDLDPVRAWVAGSRARPLVVDAKVVSSRGAWWLEEAFRGH